MTAKKQTKGPTLYKMDKECNMSEIETKRGDRHPPHLVDSEGNLYFPQDLYACEGVDFFTSDCDAYYDWRNNLPRRVPGFNREFEPKQLIRFFNALPTDMQQIIIETQRAKK